MEQLECLKGKLKRPQNSNPEPSKYSFLSTQAYFDLDWSNLILILIRNWGRKTTYQVTPS